MENEVIDVSSCNEEITEEVIPEDVSAGNESVVNNEEVVYAINTLNETMTSTTIDYTDTLNQIQTELVEIKENTSGSADTLVGIGTNVFIILVFMIMQWGYKRIKVIMKGLRDDE